MGEAKEDFVEKLAEEKKNAQDDSDLMLVADERKLKDEVKAKLARVRAAAEKVGRKAFEEAEAKLQRDPDAALDAEDDADAAKRDDNKEEDEEASPADAASVSSASPEPEAKKNGDANAKKACSDCGEFFGSADMKEITTGGQFKRLLCKGCIEELDDDDDE